MAKAAEILEITAVALMEWKIFPEISSVASQDVGKQSALIEAFLFHELPDLLLLAASERM